MKQFKLGVDLGENYAEPRQFLECAVLAEELGFDSIWFGDHFMPWYHGGGQSAYIWSLMASSLERTRKIKLGPDVTSPIGGRYHPAIIAQASATLDSMYPGRFLLGVGSGEAVNEERFMEKGWPRWKERIERLVEAICLMRKLWTSADYFNFKGRYFQMENIFLYTKPKTSIPIYFSALGPKAAVYAGRYGDHLITIASWQKCRDMIFPNFEAGAEMERKDLDKMNKMVLISVVIGDREQAIIDMKKGSAGYLASGAFDEPDPRRIELMAATVSDEKIAENIYFCSSIDQVVDIVSKYREVGADQVVIGTGVNLELIRSIGKGILPYFEEKV